MEDKEQGVYIDCIYCKIIYPEVNSINCKKCKGEGGYFRQARMMDQQTSSNYVIDVLNSFFHNVDVHEVIDDSVTSQLIGLVELLSIYNFDLKQSLIQIIRQNN